MNHSEDERLFKWWQTTIHVLVSFILLYILIFAIGFLMFIFSDRFEGILAFTSRFGQYFAASFFALILPTTFLRSSNTLMAFTAYGAISGTLIAVVLVGSILLPVTGYDKLTWLEAIAGYAGIVIAPIYLGFQYND